MVTTIVSIFLQERTTKLQRQQIHWGCVWIEESESHTFQTHRQIH